jgi:hypothetical protein
VWKACFVKVGVGVRCGAGSKNEVNFTATVIVFQVKSGLNTDVDSCEG